MACGPLFPSYADHRRSLSPDGVDGQSFCREPAPANSAGTHSCNSEFVGVIRGVDGVTVGVCVSVEASKVLVRLKGGGGDGESLHADVTTSAVFLVAAAASSKFWKNFL